MSLCIREYPSFDPLRLLQPLTYECSPGGGGWGVPGGDGPNGTSATTNGTGSSGYQFEPRGSVHNWTMAAEGT